jgi:4-hydroxyphenylpyruvate dioxygenase
LVLLLPPSKAPMKIDHIHFYVEDAAQTRDWLIQKMGFRSYGQAINPHTHTEFVGNSAVQFWVSAALSESSTVANYLASHPAGVADVAFRVDDLDGFLAKHAERDLQIISESTWNALGKRQVAIQGWGDLQHTLVEDRNSSTTTIISDPIVGIDHVVLNVPRQQLSAVTQWYEDLFDLQIQQSFEIQTDRSGLYSNALIDRTGQVQFNINEPSTANSQIQTFLDSNGGSGIQHIALSTANIFQVVEFMRSQNLAFLPIPQSYYRKLQERATNTSDFPFTPLEWQALQDSEILLDWPAVHEGALLMQIFTQPIFDAPTFFFEIIERRSQAQGFGEGNFLALFEAIEQEALKNI